MSSLFHLEHEKQYLSALIRNPALRADTTHISERDFSETHRPIMGVIDAILATGGPDALNRFVVVERLNAMSLKIGHAIEPGVYINAISLIEVNDTAAIEIAKQLKRTTVRRELHDTCMRMAQRAADDSGERSKKTALDLVAEATAAFNGKVNVLGGTGEDEPTLLYGSVRNFLNTENGFSAKAIIPPFKIMADLWGYWDDGQPTLIVSRMKIGKSSFWLSALQQLAVADKDDNLRALVLDTELSAHENQSRALSALSGVREFRVRQGWYKRNRDERERVEQAAQTLEALDQRVSHVFCGRMDLDQILSVARRWAHKNLTEGKRGIIVYDYFKLMASDFRSKTSPWVQLGEKMDAFKNLTKELRIPCLCFAQTNRENVESKAGEKQQNSGVIGGSDMLAQFASNIFLLEELSPEEKITFGQVNPGDATHTLREIACRQRGPCELGEDRMVKYKDERGKAKYCRNYLLFSFDSFNVKELFSFRTLVERNQITSVPVQAATPTEEDGGKIL